MSTIKSLSCKSLFNIKPCYGFSILFTFADAQPPPAKEVVKKAEIPPCPGATFKFNNSAVYAGRGDQSVEFFWKFGYESLAKYFQHLGSVIPTSLDQTKAVLGKREQLQFYLDDLQKKIHDGMDKLKAIDTTTMEVMKLHVSGLYCTYIHLIDYLIDILNLALKYTP